MLLKHVYVSNVIFTNHAYINPSMALGERPWQGPSWHACAFEGWVLVCMCIYICVCVCVWVCVRVRATLEPKDYVYGVLCHHGSI